MMGPGCRPIRENYSNVTEIYGKNVIASTKSPFQKTKLKLFFHQEPGPFIRGISWGGAAAPSATPLGTGLICTKITLKKDQRNELFHTAMIR